jgi:hypothetical protein
VRVRLFELRLLAGALVAGWAIAAGLILVAYRPGGPYDLLVGLTAGAPLIVAIAGLLWPPLAHGGRAFAAIVWIGIVSLLLLVPAIAGVLAQLQARGPQTLLPSLETVYPWVLALIGTAIFSGLGIAGRSLGDRRLRQRRILRASAFAIAATILASAPFAGAAIANELALRDQVIGASRFGPTDPTREAPECVAPVAAGRTARVEVTLVGDVDGRSLGSVDIRGTRNELDFRWLAYSATTRQIGQYGAARIAHEGWILGPGGGWRAVPASTVGDFGLDLRVIETSLRPRMTEAAEALGTTIHEGARARHCRVALDGPTFRAMFPQVSLLVGFAELQRWRGELEYWVFLDGQLGRVVATVSGEGGQVVAGSLQATVQATMIATERGRNHRVLPPAG